MCGLAELVSVENLGLLRDYIEGFGALTPVVYGMAYAAAKLAFLPATRFTLLAGGSLAVAGDDPTMTFVLLGVVAVLFVLLSFLPGWLRRRGEVPEKGLSGE